MAEGMGKHDAPEGSQPKPSMLTRIWLWCCTEGRHVLIELPAGFSAIAVYEFLLSPHRAENVHFIMTSIL